MSEAKTREQAADEYIISANYVFKPTDRDAFFSGWDAREPEVAELKAENERRRQCSNQEIASLRAKVEKLERVADAARKLRHLTFGNDVLREQFFSALAALDEKEGGR